MQNHRITLLRIDTLASDYRRLLSRYALQAAMTVAQQKRLRKAFNRLQRAQLAAFPRPAKQVAKVKSKLHHVSDVKRWRETIEKAMIQNPALERICKPVLGGKPTVLDSFGKDLKAVGPSTALVRELAMIVRGRGAQAVTAAQIDAAVLMWFSDMKWNPVVKAKYREQCSAGERDMFTILTTRGMYPYPAYDGVKFLCRALGIKMTTKYHD